MSRPTISFSSELDPVVRRELESLVSQLENAEPVDLPFEQANFEATAGMVWTVDPSGVAAFYVRRLSNTRLFLSVVVIQTSVSGTRNDMLRIRVPDGRIVAKTTAVSGTGQDAGTGISLRVTASAGEQWIQIRREDLATWGAATRNTTVAFQMELDVLPIPV